MTSLGNDSRESPLALGAGLRLLRLRMVLDGSGLIEEYDFTRAPVTVLYGPRNYSKSTTFKVIDYCLGDPDGPTKAFGLSVSERYVEFLLDISIDGVHHEIRRSLQYGSIGQVEVDGETVEPPRFSQWLLEQLGWPVLTIPLGQRASQAEQLTPLTFRSILRHIYRNEDSWTAFADKEQEYLRRAVISVFLGVAEERYDNIDFHLSRARRELNSRVAAYERAKNDADLAMRDIFRQLDMPTEMGSSRLSGARDYVETRQRTLSEQREAIMLALRQVTEGEASRIPGHDSDLEARYASAVADASNVAEQVAELRTLSSEYMEARRTTALEQERLDRVSGAIRAFDEVPVKTCPACSQSIKGTPSSSDDHCYVCTQPVVEDLRLRRVSAEKRTLANEIEDLDEAIRDAERDLAEAERGLLLAERRRQEIADELNDTRAVQLAPFVAELERIAAAMSQAEAQASLLPAVEGMYLRLAEAEGLVAEAEQNLATIEQQKRDQESTDLLVSQRTADFADLMNDFLGEYRDSIWSTHDVSIDSNMIFRVGSRPWSQQLGSERKVLFFLAYCYALVRLIEFPWASPPGVLMLDNPYQQGLSDEIVERAITMISEAAEEVGAQVIFAQAKPWPGDQLGARIIEMPREYSNS